MNFSSSCTLLQHKVDSTDDSCTDDVVKCLCCKRLFLSTHGLETHQRHNPQCLRTNNIDDTVSIIRLEHGFDKEGSHGSDLSQFSGNDDEASDHSLDFEDMTVNEADINFVICDTNNKEIVPPSFSVTRSLLSPGLMGKAANAQASQPHPDSYSIYNRDFNGEVLQFYRDCKNRRLKLSLDLDTTCQSRNVSSRDILIIDVFRQTRYKSPDICDEIDTVLANFWNSVYLIPGFLDSETQIVKDDILVFLFHHSSIRQDEILVNPGFGGPDDVKDNSSDEEDWESVEEIPADNTFDDNDVGGNVSGSHKSSDMRYIQKEIQEARDGITFEKRECARTALYNMLSDANCPKYLFEEVQKWASKFGDVMFGETPTKRNTFVNSMGVKVYGEEGYKLMKPRKHNLVLPRGSTIPLMTFSLKGAIISLLTDSTLMRESNLLLNCDNPRIIEKRGRTLGEINTGWWYHDTHTELCDGPDDVLLPLIFFIDGSNIDNNGRLSVEPVTMTLGIFNRSTRNVDNAWRTIGFIENLNHKKSSDKVKSNKQTKLKYQDIHAMIDHILSELKLIQGQKGGFHWLLDLNNKSHEVTFKVALQVVIGDCKGNDVLCGRYGNHSEKTRGFCRDCKVTFADSDDVQLHCEYITKDDFNDKSEKDINAMGFHFINNAFDSVCFGAGNCGIYGSSPSEPLHSFKLGLCKYLFEGFTEAAPPDTIKAIDRKLSDMIRRGQHKSLNDLPSIAVLRNGVNSLVTAGADEQMSRVFGIHLCLLDSSVMKSLATAKRFQKCPKKGVPVAIKEMGMKQAKKWQEIFEKTVLYYSWLYSDEHDIKDFLTDDEYDRYLVLIGEEDCTSGDDSSSESSLPSSNLDNSKQSIAERAVRSYLSAFKDCVCRSTGNGLKIVKFHQQLHYPNQILKDGSLLNVDGGRCESIAINNLKKPGSLSQKRALSLNQQIAHNLMCDQVMRDTATMIKVTDGHGCLDHVAKASDAEAVNGICQGSTFTMTLGNQEEPFVPGVDNVEVCVQWSGVQYNTPKEVKLQKVVAHRLFLNLEEGGCLHKTSSVKGFTEYVINGQTLRCHPSYRSGEEWKDYAMVSWSDAEEPEKGDLVPARLCMFLDLENSLFMTDKEHSQLRKDFGLGDEPVVVEPNTHIYLDRSKWVVLESCLSMMEMGDAKPTKYDADCSFSQYHGFEDHLRILPLESVVGKAYCVEIGGQGDRVACLQDKDNWKDKFYNVL